MGYKSGAPIPKAGQRYITKTYDFRDADHTVLGDAMSVFILSGDTPTSTYQDGGGLLIAPDASTDNHAALLAHVGKITKFNILNEIWWLDFWGQFSEPTQADWLFGWVGGTYTIASPSADYHVVRKPDDDVVFSVNTAKNSAGSSSSTGGAAPAAATDFHLRFVVKTGGTAGYGDCFAYVNDVLVASILGAVLCDDEFMTWMIGVQNGSAASRTFIAKRISTTIPDPLYAR